MKRRVKCWKTLTYCNWCKKMIRDYSHTSVEELGKPTLDFHSEYADGKKTCLDLYHEKMDREYIEKRKKAKP